MLFPHFYITKGPSWKCPFHKSWDPCIFLPDPFPALLPSSPSLSSSTGCSYFRTCPRLYLSYPPPTPSSLNYLLKCVVYEDPRVYICLPRQHPPSPSTPSLPNSHPYPSPTPTLLSTDIHACVSFSVTNPPTPPTPFPLPPSPAHLLSQTADDSASGGLMVQSPPLAEACPAPSSCHRLCNKASWVCYNYKLSIN